MRRRGEELHGVGGPSGRLDRGPLRLRHSPESAQATNKRPGDLPVIHNIPTRTSDTEGIRTSRKRPAAWEWCHRMRSLGGLVPHPHRLSARHSHYHARIRLALRVHKRLLDLKEHTLSWCPTNRGRALRSLAGQTGSMLDGRGAAGRLPLSQTPTTLLCIVNTPSHGNGRRISRLCSPCRIWSVSNTGMPWCKTTRGRKGECRIRSDHRVGAVDTHAPVRFPWRQSGPWSRELRTA